jgi:hypothetical protein
MGSGIPGHATTPNLHRQAWRSDVFGFKPAGLWIRQRRGGATTTGGSGRRGVGLFVKVAPSRLGNKVTAGVCLVDMIRQVGSIM